MTAEARTRDIIVVTIPRGIATGIIGITIELMLRLPLDPGPAT